MSDIQEAALKFKAPENVTKVKKEFGSKVQIHIVVKNYEQH